LASDLLDIMVVEGAGVAPQERRTAMTKADHTNIIDFSSGRVTPELRIGKVQGGWFVIALCPHLAVNNWKGKAQKQSSFLSWSFAYLSHSNLLQAN
jgi:hypothetical protein